MHVVRHDNPTDGSGATRRLVLDPLDGAPGTVVFEWYPAPAPRMAGDAFEVLAEVRGPAARALYAVFADWVVAPDGDPQRFAESRRELFGLRVRHIPVYHTDYLLRRIDDVRRVTVLGLYETEEGLTLSRAEPRIAAWAATLPRDLFGARDESGLRTFRVRSDSVSAPA